MNSPEFLRLPEKLWPIQVASSPSDEDMECRQIKIMAAVATVNDEDAIDPLTFSSWRKLIRITARILRLAAKI